MDLFSGEFSEIHFKDYLIVLRENIWLLVACCIVIVSVVAISSFSAVPLYESKAKVLIKPQPTRVLSSVEDIQPVGAGRAGLRMHKYFNTQFELIQSRIIAEQTVKRFDLEKHSYFKDASDPAKVVQSKVKVEPIKGTNMIYIVVTHKNPDIAAFLANAVAETYTWYNMESSLQKTRDAYQMLQKKLKNLKNDVTESQKDLYKIAEEEKIYIPEDLDKINSKKMSRLNESYIAAKTGRMETEVILNQIKEIQNNNGSYLKYLEISEISDDSVVSSLYQEYNSLDIKLNQLRKKYGSKHPKVQKQLEARRDVKEDLKKEIQRLIKKYKNKYRAQKKREEKYRKALNKVKKKSINLSKKQGKYELAKQQTKYAKSSYKMIQDKIKETDLLKGLRDNNVSIVERAEVPGSPFTPKIKLNILLAFIVSLLTGTTLIFMKEYFDTNIKTPEDVENSLGLPILSLVPHSTEGVSKSSLKESFNALRTSLQFSTESETDNLLLVTSSIPKEGKTSVAVNMSKIFSMSEDRILLLDCDFRRPMLHNHFNLERRNGLSAYIARKDYEDWRAIVNNVSNNLGVITCGPIPPDPPKLLNDSRFKNATAEMKKEYDWIIVDSPPIVGITDPVILSSTADGVVLVVRRDFVDRNVANRALKSLEEVDAKVYGAVFNDVDFQSAYYNKYYKYGYYYYYKNKDEPEMEESEEDQKGKSVFDMFSGEKS